MESRKLLSVEYMTKQWLKSLNSTMNTVTAFLILALIFYAIKLVGGW